MDFSLPGFTGGWWPPPAQTPWPSDVYAIEEVGTVDGQSIKRRVEAPSLAEALRLWEALDKQTNGGA